MIRETSIMRFGFVLLLESGRNKIYTKKNIHMHGACPRNEWIHESMYFRCPFSKRIVWCTAPLTTHRYRMVNDVSVLEPISFDFILSAVECNVYYWREYPRYLSLLVRIPPFLSIYFRRMLSFDDCLSLFP